MTAKLRVYEVARDLGMDQKALVSLLQSSGVPDVRNHMSSIGADVVERIRRQLEKQKAPAVVEARIHPTVVKRRAAVRPAEPQPAAPAPAASAPAPAPVPASRPSAPAPSAPAAASAPPAPAAVVRRTKAPASSPGEPAPSAPAAAPAPTPAPPPREPTPPPVVVAPPPAPVAAE